MPYTKTYVDGGKGFHKWGSGIVTGPELLASSREDLEDRERYRLCCYGLIDHTGTKEIQVTPGDIYQIVQVDRQLGRFMAGVSLGIIAPADLIHQTIGIWKTLTEDFGWKSKIFRHRSEAIAWIAGQLDRGPNPMEFPSLNFDLPPSS